jgi:beta-glucanase (GH16 family)
LSFADEFDGALDIGMQDGTKWVPGWISWNTRHLAGNSDKAWKQHDDELGWTEAWQSSGRSVGDALRSQAGFVSAHGPGPYNHEVSNGTLKMRAFRIPETLRNSDFGGFPFTAGMISTEDRFSFLHGYLELRLRFTRVEQGMHFALWTLSQDKKEWAVDYGPELDPLEVLYRDPEQGFERPSHWHQNAVGIPTQPGKTGHPFGFYEEVEDYQAWHTVGLERSPDDKVRFFVDGVLTREEDVSELPQYRDEEHYLLATWEIGGNWPGEVKSTDPYWYVEVEMDYVRVFLAD